ncbi:MAG TPA: hypothetical protein VF392_07875 [Terracidiphilus sp.]
MNENERALYWVKMLHTVAWAFFAGCIVALPILGALRCFRTAAVLAAIVLAECAILAANRFRCPLTDVAARYTTDRAPNFDIFLPRLLAQYNKLIFGTLYVVGGGYVLWLRLAAR